MADEERYIYFIGDPQNCSFKGKLSPAKIFQKIPYKGFILT